MTKAFQAVFPSLSMLLVGLTSLCPAQAQQRLIGGTSITMVIGTGPGGGYDTYARLVARHMGRFLPGNPTFVPKNMPGSDGLQEATWLYQTAPKDGTAIGIIENSTPYEPLLANTRTHIDPLKFNWLGSLNRIANIVLVWHTSPITSTQELFDKPVIVGATTGGSDSIFMPKLLNSMIGTKFKIVSGYRSSSEIVLAMERGEVQGALGISWDSLQGPLGSLIRDRKVRILMQIDLEKFPDPLLRDVPFVMDYVKNEGDRNVLKLLLAKLEYGRPFAAPPDVPAAIVTQLRTAFMKMAADPRFLSDSAKIGLPINAAPGEEVTQSIAAVYKTPQAIVKKAIAVVNRATGQP